MAVMEPLLYAVAGLGAGLFLFILGLASMRRKRLIENIPTSKVRSMAMGLVEVCGEALPPKGGLMRSPLSDKDCVYYSFSIQERRSSGRSSHWATIRKGRKGDFLYLRDRTGTVLVKTEGAKMDLRKDLEFRSGMWGRKVPGHVKAFLKSQGLSHRGFLGFEKQMRFRESVIEPGDKLYVMGTAGDNPHVKDGSVRHGHEDVMIRKGDGGILHISDRPEKDILVRLRWRMLGGLVGGALLASGSLAVILIYLGLL